MIQLLIFLVVISALNYGTYQEMDYLQMQFNLKINPDTNGFSHYFLQLPLVKQVCHDSHIDLMKVGLKDLGYCSVRLGTL